MSLRAVIQSVSVNASMLATVRPNQYPMPARRRREHGLVIDGLVVGVRDGGDPIGEPLTGPTSAVRMPSDSPMEASPRHPQWQNGATGAAGPEHLLRNDRITAALTAHHDHETLPPATAVDTAAQPNPRTRRGPKPER
jgi:hypothetical protein